MHKRKNATNFSGRIDGESIEANSQPIAAARRRSPEACEPIRSTTRYAPPKSCPLVAALDVRAASRFIDSYVLVIEWGATKVDAVQYALRNAPGLQQNIIGAVLNKVDMTALGRYDSYGARYYYGHRRDAA